MINVAVIINPESGKGRGRSFLKKLENIPIPPPFILTRLITKHRSHATKIASEIDNKFDRVIIVGGDGTFNEFINGFDFNLKIPIGLIPVGSGNDFALSLYSNAENFKSNLQYFLTDKLKLKLVDVGYVQLHDSDGNIVVKKFINSLGIGFDARVAYLNQSNKILSGSMSYIIAILRAFLRMNQIGFKVIIDKTVFNRNALFCSIGNGECVGGGLYLTSGAQIDDNLLDLSIVQLKSRLKLLRLLPKASSNKLEGVKEIEQWKFRNLEIELETPYYTHVDGEILSISSKKVEVQILNSALSLIL